MDVSATDYGGVALVKLYVDGVLFDEDITSPYSFFWDTTAYDNGTYELKAVAYDTAGNLGLSGIISVSVDNEIFQDRITSYNVCYTKLLRGFLTGRIIYYYSL